MDKGAIYQILTGRPPHGPKPIDHDLFRCGEVATSAIKLLSSVPPWVTEGQRGYPLEDKLLVCHFHTSKVTGPSNST